MPSTEDPYAAARQDAERLAALTGHDRHDVAVVLGSGWTPAIEHLTGGGVDIPYGEFAHFPRPTVAGHSGTAWSAAVGDQRVLVFSGRVHLYEGHAPSAVVHPVRTAALAGCRVVVLTNAAGALRDDLAVGGAILISDHLNLTGMNPLAGPPPPEEFGSRFCDMTDTYTARLRVLAHEVEPDLPEGVYAGLLGPSYETPAEIHMLRTLGADLVGMSTVLEAIAVRHLGAEILGLTLVTNLAAGLQGAPLAHGEVLEAGAKAGAMVGGLIRRIIEAL